VPTNQRDETRLKATNESCLAQRYPETRFEPGERHLTVPPTPSDPMSNSHSRTILPWVRALCFLHSQGVVYPGGRKIPWTKTILMATPPPSGADETRIWITEPIGADLSRQNRAEYNSGTLGPPSGTPR